MVDAAPTVHATALLFGARAVLLRGASGAGKSRLALALLAEARHRTLHAALIGDDRVVLESAGGRLVARAVPPLAGLLEVRGLGLVTLAHEPAGVVGLVVDLVDEPPPRLPDPDTGACSTEIAGLSLPRLALWTGDPAAVSRLVAALDAGLGCPGPSRQKVSRFEFAT